MQQQRHRGQHPEDAKLFADKWIPILRQAVHDLSWLLSNDYPDTASLQLVGNRFRLTERQMNAVMRCACSLDALQNRQRHLIQPNEIGGETVAIDGYNVLITLESILSGGVILLGRDGAYRDLASIHRSYKSVEETLPALQMIGDSLQALGVQRAEWYFDSPVSNSGRLKTTVMELAEKNDWNWSAELAFNPDAVLIDLPHVIITSDSWVIDKSSRWFNLLDYLIKNKVENVNLKEIG